ncbi:DNA N-6-adenine-methyltransferase [Novosphingobium gossypii]|uniref:DNA N-6-adenine-methyltransferase n=1 Tax=Novosphingobium gossypii TaxID=1604774 RepID=UPI003D212B1B
MTHERRGKSDEWYTPKYVFDALGCTFDLDVAHPRNHTHTAMPTRRFFYEAALEQDWSGFIWMNPPFGNSDRAKLVWMNRFFDHGNGIALTPDRTSAPWFQRC